MNEAIKDFGIQQIETYPNHTWQGLVRRDDNVYRQVNGKNQYRGYSLQGVLHSSGAYELMFEHVIFEKSAKGTSIIINTNYETEFLFGSWHTRENNEIELTGIGKASLDQRSVKDELEVVMNMEFAPIDELELPELHNQKACFQYKQV